MEQQNNEIERAMQELKEFIDRLNKTLMSEIPKELREANKQYRDIIYLTGELNACLTK